MRTFPGSASWLGIVHCEPSSRSGGVSCSIVQHSLAQHRKAVQQYEVLQQYEVQGKFIRVDRFQKLYRLCFFVLNVEVMVIRCLSPPNTAVPPFEAIGCTLIQSVLEPLRGFLSWICIVINSGRVVLQYFCHQSQSLVYKYDGCYVVLFRRTLQSVHVTSLKVKHIAQDQILVRCTSIGQEDTMTSTSPVALL